MNRIVHKHNKMIISKLKSSFPLSSYATNPFTKTIGANFPTSAWEGSDSDSLSLLGDKGLVSKSVFASPQDAAIPHLWKGNKSVKCNKGWWFEREIATSLCSSQRRLGTY